MSAGSRVTTGQSEAHNGLIQGVGEGAVTCTLQIISYWGNSHINTMNFQVIWGDSHMHIMDL